MVLRLSGVDCVRQERGWLRSAAGDEVSMVMA